MTTDDQQQQEYVDAQYQELEKSITRQIPYAIDSSTNPSSLLVHTEFNKRKWMYLFLELISQRAPIQKVLTEQQAVDIVLDLQQENIEEYYRWVDSVLEKHSKPIYIENKSDFLSALQQYPSPDFDPIDEPDDDQLTPIRVSERDI